METKHKPDNPSAFPTVGDIDGNGNTIVFAECGMSLRDWFAGQTASNLSVCVSWIESMTGIRHLWEVKDIARRSYQIADAMLAEREKPR